MTAAVHASELAWYHTIDLADGTATAGVFDCRPVASRLVWPPGLRGGRCLDVGTMDGFWAFEMERCGASDVLAIDVVDQTRRDLWPSSAAPPLAAPSGVRPTFEFARRDRRSSVAWQDCSVYDLDPSVHGRFDVVFVGTLLVHLRDPVAALGALRSVCAGELVVVECLDPLLDLLGRRWPLGRFAPFPNQWWRMNGAALQRMLVVAGFTVISTDRRFVTPLGRASRPSRWPLGPAQRLTPPWLYGLRRGAVEIAIRARPFQPRLLPAIAGNDRLSERK